MDSTVEKLKREVTRQGLQHYVVFGLLFEIEDLVILTRIKELVDFLVKRHSWKWRAHGDRTFILKDMSDEHLLNIHKMNVRGGRSVDGTVYRFPSSRMDMIHKELELRGLTDAGDADNSEPSTPRS